MAPAKATVEELRRLKAEVHADIEAAKGGLGQQLQRADRDIKLLKSDVEKTREQLNATAGNVVTLSGKTCKEAKQHTDGCIATLDENFKQMITAFEKKIKDLGTACDKKLEEADAALRRLVVEEISGLAASIEDELAAQRREALAGEAQRIREAQEAVGEHCSSSDAAFRGLRELVAQSEKKAAKAQAALAVELQKASELQDEVAAALEAKVAEHRKEAMAETQKTAKQIEKHAVKVEAEQREVQDALKKQETKLALRGETQNVALEHDLQAIRNELSCYENMCTRRVEWSVSRAMQQFAEALAAAPKGCEHPTFYSPPFDAGGALGLRLEFRLLEAGDGGDCAVLLWADPGLHIVYRLYIGSKSQMLDYKFDSRESCGTSRLCQWQKEVRMEDATLRVGVEILEVVRELERFGTKPPQPKTEQRRGDEEEEEVGKTDIPVEEALEGNLYVFRHVNNRVLEQVKSQLDLVKSCMVRRVEWRIEQASRLQHYFPRGQPIMSKEFDAAGVEGLQMVFYPGGYEGASEGFCSLYLQGKAGASLRCKLQVGSERKELVHTYDKDGSCGRTNFCHFAHCVEADDSVLISLEIEQAHQDLVARNRHGSLRLASPGGSLSEGVGQPIERFGEDPARARACAARARVCQGVARGLACEEPPRPEL